MRQDKNEKDEFKDCYLEKSVLSF